MDFLVNVDVDDLDKAIGFYSDTLNLHVGRRFGSAGAEMLGGSAPIYLLHKPSGSPVCDISSQVRDYSRHWTPAHLDFVVDQIEEAVQNAISAGARLERAISTQAW